jgi:hypothetical protein
LPDSVEHFSLLDIGSSPRSRLADIEVTTDFACEELVDLAVPWNGGRLASGTVHVHRVAATLAKEFAP